ncbi:MAG: hypothetical protein H6739_06830 [Alphaproteobacteria bacterium]|nr:hypothetical protein [Alphaproteobacteria bacterium]
MGWANHAIEALSEGRAAVVKPHGGSMRPKVESGATVTLEPTTVNEVQVGDIVLCRVKGNVMLHLVKALRGSDDKRSALIGNNVGRINGWTRTIYGRVVEVRNP